MYVYRWKLYLPKNKQRSSVFTNCGWYGYVVVPHNATKGYVLHQVFGIIMRKPTSKKKEIGTYNGKKRKNERKV